MRRLFYLFVCACTLSLCSCIPETEESGESMTVVNYSTVNLSINGVATPSLGVATTPHRAAVIVASGNKLLNIKDEMFCISLEEPETTTMLSLTPVLIKKLIKEQLNKTVYLIAIEMSDGDFISYYSEDKMPEKGYAKTDKLVVPYDVVLKPVL